MIKWTHMKQTRPSEGALFLRKEIIDALTRSDERTDEKMEKFLQKITDSDGTHLQGMNSIVKMKEEDDGKGKSLTWTKIREQKLRTEGSTCRPESR